MNQADAKKIIEETNYLENQILVYQEDTKTIFGKIVWKGYSAAFKDENNEDGTVRVRIKDLLTGKEFSDSLLKIATEFPKESIENKLNSKKEILNILDDNKDVQSKTLSWIANSVTNPGIKKQEGTVENLLTELWLESKVTKARFKANDAVVYSARK